jgi:hypothetical protein
MKIIPVGGKDVLNVEFEDGGGLEVKEFELGNNKRQQKFCRRDEFLRSTRLL